ncbi:MAG: hypothetical protein LBR34_11900 [Prevotella sp.]|jgi:hypothetical protein|nr:hypothetical protein [Prevotella sp.]
MKHFLTVLIGILLSCVVMGQQYTSSKERPSWVDGYFQEEANSYIESASASGYSEDEARNKAANIIIERRNLTTGARVNVQIQGSNVVVSGNNSLTVKARVIDEYREYSGGQYRVSLLVQTAKNPAWEYEAVQVTNDYPFSPAVFVPGMAQLQKGSKTKGIMFIAGEIALVGGVVVCEGLRASYESKINTTHNASDKQAYINDADNMQNLRNGFIAGAAALYAWNVIDGIVAKGKKHVIVLGDANLKITPHISPYVGSGITLSLNF